VALSTDEEEYIETCSTSSEVVWLQKLLAGLFHLNLEVTCIFCENQSCIKLSEKPVFHDKSKQVEIKFHYIQYLVKNGVVKLHYIGTNKQIADVLTKPLSKVEFEYFRDKLGMVQKDFTHKRE
jgi:hypothetical protein